MPRFCFRTLLRWLVLLAILVTIGLYVWDPPLRDRGAGGGFASGIGRSSKFRALHTIRPWVLVCGGTTVLLMSVVEVVLLFRDSLGRKHLQLRPIVANSAAQRPAGKSGSGGRRPDPRTISYERLEKQPRPGRPAPPTALSSGPRPFFGKKVLIADDDFDVSQALVVRFESLGMTAMRTSDALQLLFGVHKVKPDLVVLDVYMPTGNGLAVCEMLNSDDGMCDLPVIVYTGCSKRETVDRCRALGAHYVLKSPSSWPTIEAILYRLFTPGKTAPNRSEAELQALTLPPAIPIASAPPVEEPLVEKPAAATHTVGIAGDSLPSESKRSKPEAVPPAATAPTPSAPERAAVQGSGPGGTYRVLAIHVEAGLLAGLSERSAALGITLSSESNPERGYWECLSEMPDLVMVGTAAADSSALDVLQRLSSSPLCGKIPLLAIVGPEDLDLASSGPKLILKAFGNLADVERALRQLFDTVSVRAAPQAVTRQSPRSVTQPAAELEVIAPAEEEELASEAETVEEDSAETAAEPPAGKDIEPASIDDGQRPARQRPLVLVIDDDPDISSAIALRLSAYGIDVLPAFAGMPGYWTAVDLRPNVILCDMQMPDGEGNYIIGRLKSHPLTQNIPVIVITGQDNPGMKRMMLSLGVAAYFGKPVPMKELLTELRRHITVPDSPHRIVPAMVSPRLSLPDEATSTAG